jgi:hypothetical protein
LLLRKLITLVAVALAVSAVATVAPAGAATTGECQAQIDQLATQTQAATFTGKNADRDRSGLLSKLANANTKLSEGKNADAIQKLQDFQAQVGVLGQTGKLAPADADSLAAGADAAIACIDSIGT